VDREGNVLNQTPTEEGEMKSWVPIIAAVAAFAATGSLLPDAPIAAIPLAQDAMNPIERVAVCFYPNGWAGPGLYQCGYRLRYGQGFVERREHEEREEHRERERFEDRRDRRDRFEDRRDRRDHY
jgi:hypothetical protein